jgi:type III pantothenate kinase
MTDRYFGFPALVVEPGVKTGMPILYENPKEVGADRIADAVGAYDLFGGPTVVVDFGTATTLEAISAHGEYLGGAILPGVEISLEALFGRAAALRKVELVEPRSVIGKNTIESIQSGALYGFAAQVDGIAERMVAELGDDVTVVATGGLAGLISPFSSTITEIEPWLTLHGLRLIFEKNRR